jgi:hypothetical protein
VSTPSFHQRFKNPWPWLIALLLILLVPMWLRERHLLEHEVRKAHTFRPEVGPLAGLKISPFNDPFGNVYQLMGDIFNTPRLSDSGNPMLIVEGYDWDGSPGHRLVYIKLGEFLHVDGPLGARDIPLLLFVGLFLFFTFFWFRNFRRRRLRQP